MAGGPSETPATQACADLSAVVFVVAARRSASQPHRSLVSQSAATTPRSNRDHHTASRRMCLRLHLLHATMCSPTAAVYAAMTAAGQTSAGAAPSQPCPSRPSQARLPVPRSRRCPTQCLGLDYLARSTSSPCVSSIELQEGGGQRATPAPDQSRSCPTGPQLAASPVVLLLAYLQRYQGAREQQGTALPPSRCVVPLTQRCPSTAAVPNTPDKDMDAAMVKQGVRMLEVRLRLAQQQQYMLRRNCGALEVHRK
jgi:hypothetical protein